MSIDNVCKYLSNQYPESFINWILGESTVDTDLLKSELSIEPIRADFVALLRTQNQILHIEFQVEAISNPPLPLRMLDYFVRLYRRYNCPVNQFVIFLKRTSSAAAYTEQFVDSNTIHQYRAIRLWEQDPAPLLANPALLPLAVLAQSNSPNALLEQVASQLDMIEEREQRSNISACTGILASLRFDNDIIRQFLREDVMREAPMYQEIVQEGKREEALLFVMRLLMRQVGTTTLDLQLQVQNLTTPQLEELGVALLDFDNASDLAAWLQNQ